MFARKINNNNLAGAIDEEIFLTSFEDVPTVQIYSGKDVKDLLKKYSKIIENVNEDWSKRVDGIKRIRSLIKAGALLHYHDEFLMELNLLLPSFTASLKDLRSQVVRESCITVAYLSLNFGLKFEHLAEYILSNLINLIQNSAKIVVSSSIICIRFILRYTHTPRLIPIISNGLNSKSKDIRRSCCDFIHIILQTWHTHLVEKNASKIQEAVKKGICDADAEARAHARNAYTVFAQHFPELAESLENSLDYSYRKLLFSSNGGSNSSLSKSPSRSLSIPSSLRSNSAIDLQAVKRAKTRAQYAAMDRQKFSPGISLPKSNNKKVTSPPSEQRVSRTKSRISVSTPNSRSGSPSSRFNYSGSPSSKFNYSNYLADNLYGVIDISEIVAKCENAHWNERKVGLISLQNYIQDGNKLALSDLKKIMEIFTKIFNDPHVKVFSLFIDTLNELILSHSEDLCFCLHLLLTRLFNKLGTDLLHSDHSKIKKTLDNVFLSFPADAQLKSIFRFLVDPTQTPNTKVKLEVLNYLIRLTSIVDTCTEFSSSSNGTNNKDYAAMALNKMISWAMSSNIKSNADLRKVSQKAIVALFNLNSSQVTHLLSAMPKDYQDLVSELCSSRKGLKTTHIDELPTRSSGNDKLRKDSCSSLSPKEHTESLSLASESSCDSVLKMYLDELSQSSNNDQGKKDSLTKIMLFVQDSPSETIITHFKPLLATIISYISVNESPTIKEVTLHLLQTVVKKKSVTFLLEKYSDLIITKVILVCNELSKDVAKAAEQCAIIISTHLPAESVVRVIVPLITSDAVPVKLITIKMLMRLVECSNDSIVMENIDQIMPVLLEAYDDEESSVRKAAVFCMVSLHKQSDEMKASLEPYIAKLQGAKLKLLQVYIRRAQSAEKTLN